MGLNLDVDHVAFAADRKFDGYQYRRLTAAEFGQIAGRAGRHMRDGTFGVTSRVDPFEDELVEALETHRFDAVKTVQWRNRNLDFSSLESLRASLDVPPSHDGLVKAPPADDVTSLDIAGRDPEIRALATGRERVALLWDICQVPDYRRIAPANHAELIATLFSFIARNGVIPDDWFASQVAYADRTDGDIDTLANRIAHIRTWTFAANRPDWLRDPKDWQERTRAIEDRLSDALHERLTGRFIDRRTSVLMRRLKENAMLEAEITQTGDVLVEGQHVGSLSGFRFTPDANGDGPDAKALRLAAQKALAGEIAERAERVATASNADLVLASDGSLRWQGAAVARVISGDDALRPRLVLLADDMLTTPGRDRVQARLDLWLANHCETLLKPLFDLRAAETLAPVARGIAYRLAENFGTIERAEIAEEVRGLDQDARAGMRSLGVRFGAYNIYVPQLLKPGPSGLLAILWALKNGGIEASAVTELTQLASSGRTSVPVDPAIPRPLYRVVGYRIAGNRAVRVDILERLADLIRPLIAWRATPENGVPPDGAAPGNGFMVTVSMTSLLGCSGEDFASVLRSLGYRVERKPAPPKPAGPAPAEAASMPAEAAAAPGETDAVSAEASGEPPVGQAAAPPADAAAEPSPAPQTPAPAADEPLAVGPEAPAQSSPAEAAAPEAAPADAAASTADIPAVASEAPAEAAPAEPAFIEIWRPGRSERSGPPRDRHHRDGQRQHGRRRDDRRPAPQADGAPAEAGQAPAAGEAREERPPRDDGRPPRRGNRGGKGNRRQEGDRRHGHDGERRQGPPPNRPPERREKPIDPNSPFAALAALKAELEARKRDG
jgi:ATP-dependent RNA helicase SUPV3L1/SUV3